MSAAFVRLRRVHPTEVGLAAATLVGVLILGVLGGLLVAIALSIGVYVYRSIRPHDAILGAVDNVDGYHDVDAYPVAETVPGLIVYRFDAALYFPNAPYFKERVLALVAAARDPDPMGRDQRRGDHVHRHHRGRARCANCGPNSPPPASP